MSQSIQNGRLRQPSFTPVVPPPWIVPAMTRAHIWVYEASGGRFGPRAGRMRHILLTTRGRRSGELRIACLPYWLDTDGHRILVASDAGNDRHPGWYHNALDRSANETVEVRDGRIRLQAQVEVLRGLERSRTWSQLTEDRPFYQRYQERTRRTIPLVRLIATRAPGRT